MKSVSVFCGSSSGNEDIFETEAYALGKSLAQKGIRVIYGGAKIGLMGKVADGSLDHHGEVLGIIPGFLRTKEVAHDGLTELIIVENMHQRKTKMSELSDGIIALPGGFGTMEELFEMLTWGQLGLHAKPMGLLNTSGFYDHLIQLFDHMTSSQFLQEVNRNMVLVDTSIDGLLAQMENYRPPAVKQWMSDDET